MERSARREAALIRSLDISDSAARMLPCVSLYGDDHVAIENHGGILEVKRSVIRLYTALGVLRISGSELEIRNADRENMLIHGRISAIEYEKNDKSHQKS